MRFDEAGRIDEDIACRFCGYPLRGLDPGGACPECSARIADAGRGQGGGFEQCDPRWVGRVASGARWLAVAYLMTLIAVVATTALEIVLAVAGVPAAGLQVAMLMVFAALAAAMVGATWLFTAPDPGATEDVFWNLRRLTRWCMVTEIVHGPVQAFLQYGGRGGGIAAEGVLATGLAVFFALTTIVATFGAVLLIVYARRLASRLPAPRMASWLKLVAVGYAFSLSTVSLVAIAFIARPSLALGVTPASLVMLAVLVLALLLTLFLTCLVVALFLRLGRRLSEAAILGGSGDPPCASR